jgi:hypothetical protein
MQTITLGSQSRFAVVAWPMAAGASPAPGIPGKSHRKAGLRANWPSAPPTRPGTPSSTTRTFIVAARPSGCLGEVLREIPGHARARAHRHQMRDSPAQYPLPRRAPTLRLLRRTHPPLLRGILAAARRLTPLISYLSAPARLPGQPRGGRRCVLRASRPPAKCASSASVIVALRCFTALQCACPMPLIVHQVEISLLQRDAFTDGTLDQCLIEHITPQAWSPLAGGLLADGASRLLRWQERYSTAGVSCRSSTCTGPAIPDHSQRHRPGLAPQTPQRHRPHRRIHAARAHSRSGACHRDRTFTGRLVPAPAGRSRRAVAVNLLRRELRSRSPSPVPDPGLPQNRRPSSSRTTNGLIHWSNACGHTPSTNISATGTPKPTRSRQLRSGHPDHSGRRGP